jgi:hypothetical protein
VELLWEGLITAVARLVTTFVCSGATMESFLHYLVEQELYVVCGLLRADDFISYCKERDIGVSRERLEQLEKLGLLYPLARIKRPKIKIKLERGENGTRDLGVN